MEIPPQPRHVFAVSPERASISLLTTSISLVDTYLPSLYYRHSLVVYGSLYRGGSKWKRKPRKLATAAGAGTQKQPTNPRALQMLGNNLCIQKKKTIFREYGGDNL